MAQLYILDTSAQARTELCNRLSDFVASEDSPQDFIPHVDFKPVSPEEIKYLSPPDICVIGPQILTQELTELSRVRKHFVDVPLLVCTSKELENLSTIEQMARMGADATLPSHARPEDFLRIFIHLSQKAPKKNSGKLYIVDGGKGGVGVTSVAAALAEVSAREGKRTLVIDGDSETQDLSRFLQARPYVNENLQLLLEGQKPLSKEFVEQCYVRVWQDNPNFFCMPAMPNHDAVFHAPSKVLRQFLLVFETLDQIFDTIIVDMGCMAGVFQRALYRSADGVLFVLNDDPASLYGSVERLAVIREVLQPDAKLQVVDNAPQGGLSRKVLIREFSRAAQLQSEDWSTDSLCYCKQGMRWPGSGATLASLGSKAQLRSCEMLATDIGIVDQVSERSFLEHVVAVLKGLFSSIFGAKQQTTDALDQSASAVTSLPVQEKRRQLPAAPEWQSESGNVSAKSGTEAQSVSSSDQSGATSSSQEDKKDTSLEGIVTPASYPTW